jgi:hypothetical protein
MEWEAFKDLIYVRDGSMIDIYISDTNRKDWDKWIHFVNNNYKIIFCNTVDGQKFSKINSKSILINWGNPEAGFSSDVLIESIVISSYFTTEHEIENVLTPWHITSFEKHLELMNYMRNISVLLGKKVLLATEEGRNGSSITAEGNKIIIDPDNVFGIKEEIFLE